jgi:hypothetical protein
MTRLSWLLVLAFGAGFGLVALWGAYTFTLLNEARSNPPDEAQAIRDLQTTQQREFEQLQAVQHTLSFLLDSFASAQQAATQEPAWSAPAKRNN